MFSYIKIRLSMLSAACAFVLPAVAGAESPSGVPPQGAGAPPAVEREALVRLALDRHPSLRAAEARAAAVTQQGKAENSLPSPEISADLWQVPLSRPYALDEAGMLMFGVHQAFPAPGSLSARERAARAEADGERQRGQAAVQMVARDVRHAFADYAAATRREQAHASHRALAERLVTAARARLAAGAPLSDVTRASFELERVEADRAADDARIDSARAELNVLMGRAPAATLPPPALDAPETVAPNLEQLVARARERRPELAALKARQRSTAAEQDGAEREASWPSFSVSAFYFAPVGEMESGIGAAASMSLPWLWGGGRERTEQKRREATAASLETDEAARVVTTEVARAHAKLRAMEAREQALEGRLLPAAQKQFDAALSAYGSGAGTLNDVLEAREMLAMAEIELIDARAELDHAVADLEWSTGGALPRKPLTQSPSAREHSHGN